MIFATVGTQLPFHRLLDALDRIAGRRKLSIIAQTADESRTWPNLTGKAFLDPKEFDTLARDADVIVGHAGIGTVLTAMEHRKPLILFPRRASLREHRNEHQLATVGFLQGRSGLYVASDEAELDSLLTREDLRPAILEEAPTRHLLIARVRDFIISA